jgi:hypothetical protein
MDAANPFVHSRFERREADNYQTVDPRCLEALLGAWGVPGPAEDPCVSEAGESALISQAPWLFGGGPPKSVVTNPPYKLSVVDAVVGKHVDRVRSGELVLAAFLVRGSWDQAVRREVLLDEPPFAGLVRLRFRPWWTDSRDKQPIHNYQWLVFDGRHRGDPVVRYAGAT